MKLLKKKKVHKAPRNLYKNLPSKKLMHDATAGAATSASAAAAVGNIPAAISAPTESVLGALENDFLSRGWLQWHSGVIGGNKTQSAATALLRNTSRFLLGVLNMAIHQKVAIKADITLTEFFVCLVMERKLQDCMDAYINNYSYSASTLACHLYEMQESARWLSNLPDLPDAVQVQLPVFKDKVHFAAKGAKKLVKKEHKAKDNSIENAVFRGKYPPGGMDQVRSLAIKDAEELCNMFKTDRSIPPEISKQLFNRILQVSVALPSFIPSALT